MGETVIRIIIFFALASFAVWCCNYWFKKEQKLTVSRTRKKWKRLCKSESFDSRSIASQRLDSRRLFKFGRRISWPIAVLLAAYISNFAFKLPSSEPEQWGQMGDFFGGMLNPILAFASFIALLYTIRIQSEELRLTREEFAKSVKAQERMVGETERNRIHSVALEDYQYICSLLRDQFKTLEKRLSENSSVYLNGSAVNLYTVLYHLGNHFRSLQSDLSEQEKFDSAHDYISNVLFQVNGGSNVIQEAMYEYCFLAKRMTTLLLVYQDTCKKIQIDIDNEPIHRYECDKIGVLNAYAYAFSGVQDISWSSSAFKEHLNLTALIAFESELRHLNLLSTKPIDTF